MFQVINQRYQKTSIALTTNRPVDTWGEILGDTIVAVAILDRLLHRSVVVTLDGASYRLRNHHAAADELRRVTIGTKLHERYPATWGPSMSNLGRFAERRHGWDD
ncbi:ATP-binding protein [Microbacterium trichothecenolyticum]|uniref:ATP-binding protein n=1 Tax=Microbacterium trichothecenolyticum TaxID=69370 RepID=UPI00286B96A8|nr:ATP-binding protein [Microbacterium trichothecenolyticum]